MAIRFRGRRVVELRPALTREEATNVLRSKKRVESGKSFEKTLAQSHEIYDRQGVAMLEHLEPPHSGPMGARFVTGSAKCDYIGWWRPYGKGEGNAWPVAFDAKSFNAPTLKLQVVDLMATPKVQKEQQRDRDRLKRQCQFLVDFTERGQPTALGFLLVFSLEDDMGWILLPDALKRILAGEALKLRDKNRDGTLTHHFPLVQGSTILEMAQGHPRVDWRRVLLQVHPLLASNARRR